MLKKSFFVFVLSTFMLVQPSLSAPNGEKAKAFIQTIAQQTLVILSKETPKHDRVKKMIPLLKDNIATSLVGRAVMGANYRLLKDDLATQYNELFPEWASLSVATKLGGINLKSFTVQDMVVGKKDVTVRSVVVDSKGLKVTADWRVRDIDGTLKIIDLKLQGISMIVTQRSEFATIIKTKGIKEFLNGLSNSITKMQNSLTQ